MKKLILLFSHKLTPVQEEDAYNSLGVSSFVSLPNELQELWSNVPSELESVDHYLMPLKEYCITEVKTDDVVLVQGDFGATCHLVQHVQSLGANAVYATTKRDVVEVESGDKIIKKSVFEHVRFRAYG